MIYLNPTQEKYLIRYMIHHPDLFVNSGASRAVFFCTTDIADYLGLPEKDSNSYVLKVALGKGGMAQNQVECETFDRYQHMNILAHIEALGRYVELMEAVEVWDFRDEADYGGYADEIYDNNQDYMTEADADKVADVIGLLSDLFGETSDNGQIGKTKDGRWVAYDYGFIPDKGHDSQTSDISNYIESEDHREEYLVGLLELLDNEEDFMSAWEKTFLSKEEICEYDDQDEDDYIEEKDTAYLEREDASNEEKDYSFTN